MRDSVSIVEWYYERLMSEIQFQLIMLNKGDIDRVDFCNAIAEIVFHEDAVYKEHMIKKYGKDALKDEVYFLRWKPEELKNIYSKYKKEL
tara:strand:- start:631 stop:900 length:270 start_codon:yes stop_codon:yes gene_type:complete